MESPLDGMVVPRADFAVSLAALVVVVLILWLGLVPSALLALVSQIAAAMPSLT
jgi:hypothetical protein